MTEIPIKKQYNLEERTFAFAQKCREFVNKLQKISSNIEDSKQLIRSSGSVGANYIEANESLSKKDFVMRVKICRKETKESRYWLELIDIGNNSSLEFTKKNLIDEATQLLKIFSSICAKSA